LDALFKTKERKEEIYGNYKDDPSEMVSVVLVDELDALLTKKQDLLYNLFDWPCHPNAKLIIIGIANTMDLPERFQVKIISRLGNQRLVYEPYTRDQIQKILDSRLQKTHIFSSEAIRYISAKVAAISGDIRRSLQLCKRAVEICKAEVIKEKESGLCDKKTFKNVEMTHINQACNELYTSKNTNILKELAKYEAIILVCILLELTVKKLEKASVNKAYSRFLTMIHLLSIQSSEYKTMSEQRFMTIVSRLKSMGILLMQKDDSKGGEDYITVQLLVFPDEISSAYEDKEFYIKFEDQIAPKS